MAHANGKPGDFDSGGKTDFAVFRPSTGTWYVIRSSSPGAPIGQQWGTSGDIPVVGDFDGDGKTDFAVFRPSTGTWYVILSGSGTIIEQQWGTNGDIPVAGDFDGDGRTDIAVFRPSTGTWYAILSGSGTIIEQQWGTNGDIPVAGDFDGDGRTDIAVFRPSTGTWYAILSGSGTIIEQQWGTNGDIPVLGDFDGDGKTDFAVFRPATGTWYIIPSGGGPNILQRWGTNGDMPIEGPIGAPSLNGNVRVLPAISFVQMNSATPQTSPNPITVTYTTAQTAGDLNVVVVGWNDSLATITSVADSAGNSYLAAGPTTQVNIASQAIYYAPNILTAPANGNTVTVTFDAVPTGVDIRIAEYSGLDPSNPLDAVASAQGDTATERRARQQRPARTIYSSGRTWCSRRPPDPEQGTPAVSSRNKMAIFWKTRL